MAWLELQNLVYTAYTQESLQFFEISRYGPLDYGFNLLPAGLPRVQGSRTLSVGADTPPVLISVWPL